MRMRIVLMMLLVLGCFGFQTGQSPYFLIFTNDGTFYKLDSHRNHIDWYSSFKFKLISLEFQEKSHMDHKIANNSYFIPTIDGNFVYVDKNREILIQRKQVEQMLNVCFDSQEGKSSHHLDEHLEAMKYFVYEKFQYYAVDLHNGQLIDLERFLKEVKHVDRYVVLKIAKKFIKQLNVGDMSTKWSVLSSKIDAVPARQFFKNPKATSETNNHHLSQSKFEVRRLGSKIIQLFDLEESNGFQIGGNSAIMSVFEFVDQEKGFIHHPLKFMEKITLAIEDKSSQSRYGTQLVQKQALQTGSKQFVGFPHSEHFRQRGDIVQQTDINQGGSIEFCINSFRNYRRITEDVPPIFHFQDINQSFRRQQHPSPPNLLYFQKGISYAREIVPSPTKQQPYIWISLIIVIIIASILIYKVKINKVLNELSNIENSTDKRFEEIREKLGQFEEVKKMYDVIWDKIVYSGISSKKNIPQEGKQDSYEYIVFEGRFLNQETLVYAVRIQGADIISIEHTLEILLNCSHKSLCKLYYYTRNSQFLLIFTEKFQPLILENNFELFNNNVDTIGKVNLAVQILETANYLTKKIELTCLSFESFGIQVNNGINQHGQSIQKYQFKLNAIPSLLKKPQEEDNGQTLKLNLVGMFNMIFNYGKLFNKEQFEKMIQSSNQSYLEFFQYILEEEPIPIEGEPKEQMIERIMQHPFLWIAKRKMLFLSDFSNYIETHIDQTKIKKFQSHAKDFKIIPSPWIRQFHHLFAKEVSSYRKYDFDSVRDLIRVIRNKLNHFHEIPRDVKMVIGKTPEDFTEYCLEIFPKLMQFMYVYTKKKKWKLHMK